MLELIADRSGTINNAYTYDVRDKFGLIATAQKLSDGTWKLVWTDIFPDSEDVFDSFSHLKAYVVEGQMQKEIAQAHSRTQTW